MRCNYDSIEGRVSTYRVRGIAYSVVLVEIWYLLVECSTTRTHRARHWCTATINERLRRRADRANGTVSVEQERPQLSGHR
eukprot:COSAG02_NODE_46821_length_345_cov_20.284553_1_plen_80_part_01